MTKLLILILILILKIVVVVVVGVACGALILRFIFEVGATQTSTPRQRITFGDLIGKRHEPLQTPY